MGHERIDIEMEPENYQLIIDAIAVELRLSPESKSYIDDFRGSEDLEEMERGIGKAVINEFLIKSIKAHIDSLEENEEWKP